MKKMLLILSMFFCVAIADEFVESKTTVGGYGELHYDMEGNGGDGKLDFHRFIVYFKHVFNEQWSLMSEVEIEHNMVGSSDALGYKGGYVAMEQAYLNYFNGNWGFKGGVVLVPAGITNEYHEPPTFMSVERPEYNKYIIPTTWFDNGFAFYGSMGDFNWNVTMTGDMNGDEIGAGIRDGRMKGYGSSTADWTKTFQMSWTGMEGLKLGGSYTMNDAPTSDVTTITTEGVTGGWDHTWAQLAGECSVTGSNDQTACELDDTAQIGTAASADWTAEIPNTSTINGTGDGCTDGGTSALGDWTDCTNFAAEQGTAASADFAPYSDGGTEWIGYSGDDYLNPENWELTPSYNAPVTEVSETVNNGPVGVKLMELNGTYSKDNMYARFEYGSIDYENNSVESSSGYYLDLGYNVADMMGCDGDLYVWGRTSSYSKDDDVETTDNDISMFGVMYKPLDNISLKMEMGTKDYWKDGVEKSDDIMRLGLGYMF